MSQSPRSVPQHELTSVCVFCGANAGQLPVYNEVAAAMGRILAERNLSLVYGGGSVGLMGILARTAAEHGCHVTSIIPRSLMTRELSGELIGEPIIVDTMLQRKTIMAQRSDAFITMPGGFGTLDELFEMITWGQLGIHAKPLGILNVAGYYDPLLQMIDHAVDHGFIRPKHRQLVVSSTEPADLLDKLEQQELPEGLVKWIDIEQT